MIGNDQANIDPAYRNLDGRFMLTIIRFFHFLYPSFSWLLSSVNGLRWQMLNIGPLQPSKIPDHLTLITMSLPVVDVICSAS